MNVFTGWAIIILEYRMNKIDCISDCISDALPTEADYLLTEIWYDGTWHLEVVQESYTTVTFQVKIAFMDYKTRKQLANEHSLQWRPGTVFLDQSPSINSITQLQALG